MASPDPFMDDEYSCALCQRPIVSRQEFVFRVDGRVEHFKCPMTARRPGARVVPEPPAPPQDAAGNRAVA